MEQREAGPSWWKPVAAAVLALSVLTAAPRDARADSYKDEKLGFSLNSPKKWKQLAVAPDEKWIVASFSSDREWRVDDPKTNTYEVHRPQIDVVILPKSETEKKPGGATVEKTDEGTVITLEKAHYKDIKDYLEQTSARWGGFFMSGETETKVGTMKVMVYEYTIDKLANAPRKRWAWAFYADDAIYGVVGDGLIKFEEKVRPEIEAAFKTFKVFPHTAALGTAATGKQGDIVIRDSSSKKLTPEERKKKNEDAFNAYLASLKEKLPEGWKIKESPHYVAVSHADPKFTTEILDHAEALRGWLDESLTVLGEAVPGKVIVRICSGKSEYESMWKTGGSTSYHFEVYTYDDKETTVDSRLWPLNWGLFRTWLSAKNEDLGGRMPFWLDLGLRDCVTTAQSKGKKVEFKASQQQVERIALMARAKDASTKLLSAKDFLTKDTESLFGAPDARVQAEFFCRFLLAGAAQKNPKYKALLMSYLTNFVAMVKEESGTTDSGGGGSGSPQSEEEESALFKERQNAWRAKEKEILNKLMEKTFVGWEDKDWDAFNKTYWKELGV